MLVLVPLLAPVAAGLLGTLARRRRHLVVAAVVAATLVLLGGVLLSWRVAERGPLVALHGLVRVDALSALMVLVIGVVAVLATLFTGQAVPAEEIGGHERLYAGLVQAFVVCMVAAVLAANLGVLWVAVEATTVATTFLVGHHRTRRAFEASWKYAILCGVGIALAFLGLVVLYFASAHGPLGTHAATLDWANLAHLGPRLDPQAVRLAFGLVVLGFGTKVGLAPMHSWLPDAHAEAPAPVSALMSGVLLAVALYAVLRVRLIAALALGPTFPRVLLVVVGLASLLVAALLMVTQRDYKRLLAYSSVEHMGLCALGAAVATPLALTAVMLQLLGHALTKSSLFLVAGEVHHSEGTTQIARVRGLLARRPALGGLFAAGLLSLSGLPPFSIFLSELMILRSLVDARMVAVAAVALVLLVVVVVSMGQHARTMLLGPGEREVDPAGPAVVVPLALALGASVALGILGGPLTTWLHSVALTVVR